VTAGGHASERSRSASLSGLVLFEAGELIPIPVSESGERIRPSAERHRPQRDAHEHLGRNLRLAFPLPDSGSFAGLLGGIEDA
jgi:hypothetical protein